jgi:hypothetical protein
MSTGQQGAGLRGTGGCAKKEMRKSVRVCVCDCGLTQPCEGLQPRGDHSQESSTSTLRSLSARSVEEEEAESHQMRISRGDETGRCEQARKRRVDPRLQHLQQLGLDSCNLRTLW